MTTRQVVVVSLLVDILDVVTNLVVTLVTGSAVVFAEMAQGLADAMGSLLLFVGHSRSERPRDAKHPLGYGRETFFWALLSALTMLLIGAGLSVWRGLAQLARPEPLDRPLLALAVVVLSTVTNEYAVSRSVKRLRLENPSLRAAYRTTSRQLVKTALLQDSLGTTSAVIGIISIVGYLLFGAVMFDAVGALMLAALMVSFAALLISEARSLIAGRAVPASVRDALLAAVRGIPQVVKVNRLDAVFAGREQILVDIDVDLVEDLTTMEVEGAVDRVQAALCSAHGAVSVIRVDLNSPPAT